MRQDRYTRHPIDFSNLDWYKGWDLFRHAWIGPTFNPSDPQYLNKMSQLQRIFQEHNFIGELVDNWRDGLISEPFTWYLKDRSGSRVEAEAAELALQRWIDWVNQQGIETDPTTTFFDQSDPWSEFVLSVGVLGEGNLRLWQPEKFAEDPDPIHRIHLHAAKAGSVSLDRSRDGFVERITYSYGDRREVQTMDASGQVLVDTGTETLVLPTDRRWLIQRTTRSPIITAGAKKKQGSVCHALTMKLRNQEVGGFKERTLINAEFPQDSEGNPLPVERGPGIDSYVYGIPIGDPNNPSYALPSVHESQPVAVTTFLDSIAIDRQLLYLEFRQGHLLAGNDGGLSGESRIQMRQAFELYLRGWRRSIESAFANVLNIVLRILGYTELEAVVELKITTGKLSFEEQNAIIRQFEAGLLSRTTAMAKLGTTGDVDAEMALMDEEITRAMARTALSDPFDLGEAEADNDAA